VAAGNTVSATFPVVTNGNWYDFKATTIADTNFIRRFAGHLEPQPSSVPTALNFILSGGVLHFTWAGNAAVKLQKTTDLIPASWVDVPGSLGASAIDVPLNNAAGYFRLAQ
jgi:hypothetical protein